MEYRMLGKSGLKVSVISFGGMRIPNVSDEVAYKAVNRCIDLGINFFETAPGYGDSERKIGLSLGKRRKDIFLSTKTTCCSADAFRKKLDEQLRCLQTDYLDFYQMWYVNSQEEFEKVIAPGSLLEGARSARKEGIIKHIGITTHAPNAAVKNMITSGLFESITLYHNLFKQEYAEEIKLAREKNMGVVIMGPLNGGILGDKGEKFNFLQRGKAKSNAVGALRWLIGNPDISTAIVGIDTPEHAEEVVLAGDMYEDIKNTNDVELLSKEAEKFRNVSKDGCCTWCQYCKECPAELNIWEIMDLHTVMKIYGTLDTCKDKYAKMKKKANLCTECGKCNERCPQHLQPMEQLKKAHQKFN